MANAKSSFPILYKPAGSSTSGGAGRVVVATAGGYNGGVDIVDAKGNVIASANKDTFKHIPEPGEQPGPFGQNWNFGVNATEIPPGSLVRVKGPDGYQYTKIANPFQKYRGAIDSGEGTLENPAVVPSTGAQAPAIGVPGQFQPGQVGQYGAAPAYIGGMFPTAAQASYTPIKAAPYQFTDPAKFGEAFGQFNRGEITKNQELASQLALKQLTTELQGLQQYTPAAAALKRNETSIDNQFNQAQRTAQINSVLPNATKDLNQQASDARAYAAGKIPDSVANQAYELGIRSAAADRSSAGGFGATSSVARKASDLLSATQRVDLSKYGNSLLSSNLTQSANLLMSPTEYSNAGAQISAAPSQSASQLSTNIFNQTNALASIPATTGLQSTTQQNQYTTGLQQQTNQFNASNQLGLSEYNTSALNNFAMSQFGYNAGYATSIANAAQTNLNTGFQLQQQQMYMQLMQQYMQNAQDAGNIMNLFKLGSTALGNLGGINSTVDKVTGKGSSNTDNTSLSMPTSQPAATPNIGTNGNYSFPPFGTQYNSGTGQPTL